LAALFLSTWFTYPGPDVDTRNLAPVFAVALALLAATLGVAGIAGSRVSSIAALVVPTHAHLQRDGQRYRADDGLDERQGMIEVAHEGAS